MSFALTRKACQRGVEGRCGAVEAEAALDVPGSRRAARLAALGICPIEERDAAVIARAAVPR
jgi:hypothetical protein